jgi:bacterioferritin (cytochrome b1)
MRAVSLSPLPVSRTRFQPQALGWLQRALRHEFAAARQFTLQAAVARRLGENALADESMAAAAEELTHARLLAEAIHAAGVACGEGAAPGFPVGASAAELLAHAIDTEAEAVRLYRAAATACTASTTAAQLFAQIGAEEALHLEQLQERLRRRGA